MPVSVLSIWGQALAGACGRRLEGRHHLVLTILYSYEGSSLATGGGLLNILERSKRAPPLMCPELGNVRFPISEVSYFLERGFLFKVSYFGFPISLQRVSYF